MSPNELSRALRQIARKIDNSKSPSKQLLIRDISRLASSLRKANDNACWSCGESSEVDESTMYCKRCYIEALAEYLVSVLKNERGGDLEGGEDLADEIEEVMKKESRLTSIDDLFKKIKESDNKWVFDMFTFDLDKVVKDAETDFKENREDFVSGEKMTREDLSYSR